MIKTDYETGKARVEMLPLIDVIFLLLVYFIYAMASMTVNKGIKVELPWATTGKVTKGEISISIGEDNSIFIGTEKVEENQLIKKLFPLVSSKENTHIIINGHRNSSLGVGLKILDLMRGAGINEVSFACTEKPL